MKKQFFSYLNLLVLKMPDSFLNINGLINLLFYKKFSFQ
jgi:hypothetical protein